jgi:hypothetical protein
MNRILSAGAVMHTSHLNPSTWEAKAQSLAAVSGKPG